MFWRWEVGRDHYLASPVFIGIPRAFAATTEGGECVTVGVRGLVLQAVSWNSEPHGVTVHNEQETWNHHGETVTQTMDLNKGFQFL